MKKMKDILALIFAVLAFRIQVSRSQDSTTLCPYGYMECQYNNPRLIRAGPNQFTIHYTWFRQNESGSLECLARRPSQYRGSIEDHGTEELMIRIIHSPEYYIQLGQGMLLTEYRVQCRSDELIFFSVIDMYIRPTNCSVPVDQRCNLIIDQGIGEATALCNMTTHTVSGPNATIRLFAEKEQYQFIIMAVCFKPEERDLPGCPLDDLTSTPGEVNELCLSIPHGLVCYSGNSNASVAVYMCSDGYSLVGDSERVCQSSGDWSGGVPQCIAEEGEPEEEEDGNLSSATMVSITAVSFMLIFLVVGALIGALLCHLIRKRASKKPSYDDAVSEVYDELPTPTTINKQGDILVEEKSQNINTVKDETCEERAATPDPPHGIYECMDEVSEQGTDLAAKGPQEIETDVNDAYGQREVLAAITAQPTNEL